MNLKLESVVRVGDGDIYSLTMLDPNLDERFTVKINKSNSKAYLLEKIKVKHSAIIQKRSQVQETDDLLRAYIEGLDSSGW